MKLYLYQFTYKNIPIGLSDDELFDYTQYVLTTKQSEEIKDWYLGWVSVGVNSDIFAETFENGSVKLITSLKDIKNITLPSYYGCKDSGEIIPYTTDEQVDNEKLGGTYLYLGDISINSYFEKYFNKTF